MSSKQKGLDSIPSVTELDDGDLESIEGGAAVKHEIKADESRLTKEKETTTSYWLFEGCYKYEHSADPKSKG